MCEPRKCANCCNEYCDQGSCRAERVPHNYFLSNDHDDSRMLAFLYGSDETHRAMGLINTTQVAERDENRRESVISQEIRREMNIRLVKKDDKESEKKWKEKSKREKESRKRESEERRRKKKKSQSKKKEKEGKQKKKEVTSISRTASTGNSRTDIVQMKTKTETTVYQQEDDRSSKTTTSSRKDRKSKKSSQRSENSLRIAPPDLKSAYEASEDEVKQKPEQYRLRRKVSRHDIVSCFPDGQQHFATHPPISVKTSSTSSKSAGLTPARVSGKQLDYQESLIDHTADLNQLRELTKRLACDDALKSATEEPKIQVKQYALDPGSHEVIYRAVKIEKSNAHIPRFDSPPTNSSRKSSADVSSKKSTAENVKPNKKEKQQQVLDELINRHIKEKSKTEERQKSISKSDKKRRSKSRSKSFKVPAEEKKVLMESVIEANVSPSDKIVGKASSATSSQHSTKVEPLPKLVLPKEKEETVELKETKQKASNEIRSVYVSTSRHPSDVSLQHKKEKRSSNQLESKNSATTQKSAYDPGVKSASVTSQYMTTDQMLTSSKTKTDNSRSSYKSESNSTTRKRGARTERDHKRPTSDVSNVETTVENNKAQVESSQKAGAPVVVTMESTLYSKEQKAQTELKPCSKKMVIIADSDESEFRLEYVLNFLTTTGDINMVPKEVIFDGKTLYKKR